MVPKSTERRIAERLALFAHGSTHSTEPASGTDGASHAAARHDSSGCAHEPLPASRAQRPSGHRLMGSSVATLTAFHAREGHTHIMTDPGQDRARLCRRRRESGSNGPSTRSAGSGIVRAAEATVPSQPRLRQTPDLARPLRRAGPVLRSAVFRHLACNGTSVHAVDGLSDRDWREQIIRSRRVRIAAFR